MTRLDEAATELQAKLESIPPPLLALSAFALGSASTAVLTLTYARFFRRFKNGNWVTPEVFARKRWIKGVVTTVGDADNFRLYHTPGLGWRWPLKVRRVPSSSKGLKDQTLHIRIAGVDAPEAAHFGRPAQPYAEESLAWLRGRIEERTVYCQLLRRDQYARIVANVVLKPRVLPGSVVWGPSLPLEMLRAGWVTTYTQAGAEYGKWGVAEFLRVEGEAKAARRGMWKDGLDGETPAEYKRRYATGGVEATSTKKTASSRGIIGWIKRLYLGA